MARWTGTWLTGPPAGPGQEGRDDSRGRRLGLPAEGPGSVASFGARAGAFAVDAVLCGLVARLFVPVRTGPGAQTAADLAPLLVLTVVYLVGLLLVGQTPGMRLVGLRVVPVRPAAPQPVGGGPVGGGPVAQEPALGLVPVALRTALLLLLVPALVVDRDGRGLHDRAAGAVVVRARASRQA